jgi:serine/threonine-protein kinase
MTHPRRQLVTCFVAAALLALAAARPPRAQADPCVPRFAAVAYSECTGRYGYTYGKACLADAEAGALANCGARDARIVGWVENGWVALARSPQGSAYGFGWSTRSLAEAEAIALRACPGYIAVWTAS